MKGFFSKLLSGSGEVSSKRVAFLSIVFAGIIWLSVDLRNGMTANWVSSFQGLLALAGGSYVLGKGVERMGTRKDDESENP